MTNEMNIDERNKVVQQIQNKCSNDNTPEIRKIRRERESLTKHSKARANKIKNRGIIDLSPQTSKTPR